MGKKGFFFFLGETEKRGIDINNLQNIFFKNQSYVSTSSLIWELCKSPNQLNWAQTTTENKKYDIYDQFSLI